MKTPSASRRAMVAAMPALALAGPLRAQPAFPAKPISLLVPFAPGGGADLSVRMLAKAAEATLGQPVTIVNKPAGGGATAMREVAQAAPDGYTLVDFSAILATIAPHIRDVPYDPLKDFTPIMNFGAFNTFVAVRAESPYRSLEQLLEFARANPRVATIGISVIGASSHLGMARVAADRKVDFTFVPFGGGAPAVTALLGRHVTAAVTSGEVLPHVKSGEVRLLASLMGKRAPDYPDVPTVRDLGFSWSMNSWLGIAGPAGMPAEVVARLEKAFLQAMQDPVFRKTMTELAMVEVPADRAAARRLLEEDFESFGVLVKELRLGRYAPK
jgi:tripartite-type tricarboxylate transporter receptor subunit TctC